MKLYKTTRGPVVEHEALFYQFPSDMEWDDLVNRDGLQQHLLSAIATLEPLSTFSHLYARLLPPIGQQEVWAAGVTYYRSRTARIEESAGAGDFYDRVYEADRPELFFKATPHRVAGHLQEVKVRSDSRWNVPEPELTFLVTSSGKIIGCTIGNDMSSRDIEGDNPLYLPQAKVYDKSCAIGPGILVTSESLPASTEIKMEIAREDSVVFSGATALTELKRTPELLVEFLFRDNTFPHGCFLLTGTGIVPPDEFSLERMDEVRITIEPIGTLVNRVH